MPEIVSISECWLPQEGSRLHYLRSGAGPAVVLLHGFLGGSFCWRFTLPALARKFEVYALDLPGLSDSEAERGADCGMAAQARRVQSFLEEMGLHDVALMGCSFGGAVALHAVLQEKQRPPGRIRSLVLAAPVNPWSQFGGKRRALLRTSLGRALLRLALPYSRALHPWGLRRLYGDPARIPAGTLEGYSPQILRRGRAEHVLSAIQSWEQDVQELRRLAGEINLPALLVWGDLDRAVDPASCAKLEQRLPGCQVRRMPGVGHLPFEESPDEFNRAVMEFLENSHS